jgi:hypothetical protein
MSFFRRRVYLRRPHVGWGFKVVGRVLFYSTVRQGDTQTIRAYLQIAVQEFLAPRKYVPFKMTGALVFIL